MAFALLVDRQIAEAFPPIRIKRIPNKSELSSARWRVRSNSRFDAGVVHHYVDTTELLHRRVDEFLEVGALAHVSCDANGLAAKFADLPLERLGRFRMDHVIDDDAGLLTGQFENDR